MATIHIIGAGLAGLAAAAKLADSGHRVCVYESSGMAGGRCRSYHDPILDRRIDNGNHLIVNANQNVFEYLELIKASDLVKPAGEYYEFYHVKHGSTWRIGPPIWLPRLPLIEYRHLLGLMLAGGNRTVARAVSTSSQLYKRAIEPLCTSILNTKPHEASAKLFRSVWRRSGNSGGIPYLPVDCLQDSFVSPALRLLKSFQHDVYYQHGLKSFETESGYVTTLQFGRNTIALDEHDQIILATPANVTAALLDDITTPTEHNAIINGHFVCDHGRPVGSILGLVGGTAEWLFFKDGMISTTTSAANEWLEHDQDALATMLWQDIDQVLNVGTEIPDYRIVTEKRATFAATPKQLNQRPHPHTQHTNLLLAGDYTDTGLPATMEGAIKSGFFAASETLKKIAKQST